jgi:alkaline phosphatase D
MTLDRRTLLKALAAAGLLPAAGALRAQAAPPRFAADPFSLGTASGYPRPDGMVLWTRLAPLPHAAAGGLDPEPVTVRWEVARDEGMRELAASGEVTASPAWAHSVHVEVRGLAPARPYWYRFSAGAAQSRIARTLTAPAPGTLPAALRLAFASCQQYEQGWFTAHRHIAADNPDLVAFLGDYIYESSWGREHVRKHNHGEPYALEDYRLRYALYKADPDLQAAHAACPWILTWDDHEVDNDYADDRPEDGMPAEAFLLRRAAAYKAFYEHQPLPAAMRPAGPAMRLHARLDWGALARFHVLDGRQYRSHQACPRRAGGSNVIDTAACAALADPALTMLGGAQEAWLEEGLRDPAARWNLLAQATLMAQLDRSKPGEGRRIWTDGWDGYPAARRRLLDSLTRSKSANPVVLGGDVHMHWVTDLKSDFDDPASAVVASEIVGTSITSQAMGQKAVDALLARNPHLKYGRSDRRGYVRVELGARQMRAELRGLDSVKVPDSPCQTLASFVIEDGRPGAQRD